MMVHRYECQECADRRLIFADTAEHLSMELNKHNDTHHPSGCCTWTASGIMRSKHYRGPDQKTLPQYTTPRGTTQNSLATIDQKITDEDRKLLDGLLVKW